jgi:protein-L-isoaspartate(D-aspartate) O-methyltransferase
MNGFALRIAEVTAGIAFISGLFSVLRAEETGSHNWKELRMDMIETQIKKRGIKDPNVLHAMRTVKRHELVPEAYQKLAYQDHPLPIGEGQTISQPYIVGLMSELLQAKPGDKILEIGTGSGYQAAVLAEMGLEVYSIEIIESLAKRAAADLKRLGYFEVRVKQGDGYLGWPEEAPFDGIIITAAPPQIPQPLIDQLKPGGRLVVPVGRETQDLNVYIRKADGTVARKTIIPVRFVPMTGRAQENP